MAFLLFLRDTSRRGGCRSALLSKFRRMTHSTLQNVSDLFRLITVSALVLLWPGYSAQGEDQLPNIVILLSDDLGWADLGCYDGPVQTPVLDKLAQQGMRFTNFYSGAAVCSPSRAVLMTGRTNLRCGIYSWINDYDQRTHLPSRETTIAEVLKTRGYATAHFGKWHLGMPSAKIPDKPLPDQHGFDYWLATANNARPSHRNPDNFILNGEPMGPQDGYACDLVVEHAIRWLKARGDAATPFFLNVWFHEPHAPLAAPADLIGKNGDLEDPAAVYSATIENTDRAIGRLIEHLHQIDAPENTIIVYSSDNGSYRGDRVGNLRGTKGSNYEGGIRVPGIFYWPTHIPAATTHEPAGLVDVLPTLCGLTGTQQPNVQLDGTNLSNFLLHRETDIKRKHPLFWGLPLSGPAFAIREGRYSMVASREGRPPRDYQALEAIQKEIEQLLRDKGILEEETRGSTLARQLFEGFEDREAEQLRGKFIRLNQFNESWIPAIKESNLVRFELYDLESDPAQEVDLSTRLPQVHYRMKAELEALAGEVLEEAWDWSKGETPPNSKHIHRLDSPHRSPFDAFVYVNRIPLKTEAAETQTELAGRILGRLANQEGRVLIKLPPRMNREAYAGFKLALESGANRECCTSCHHLPTFSQISSTSAIPTFRSRTYTRGEFDTRLKNKTHQTLELDATTLQKLHAFQQSLVEIEDSEFRDQIIRSAVMEMGEDP